MLFGKRFMISQSSQDYLKTIYKLTYGVRPVDSVTTSLVAEKMDVAPASATNMLKKLDEMKLVEHTPYQGVFLTPTGRRVALEVIRHHRLLEYHRRPAALHQPVSDASSLEINLDRAGNPQDLATLLQVGEISSQCTPSHASPWCLFTMKSPSAPRRGCRGGLMCRTPQHRI